jgi:hypothetical protein
MPAVLVALYEGHPAAERVRNRLVHEGFPTDRVRLTSGEEPGEASSVPAGSREKQLHRYFRSLFDDPSKRQHAEQLAERVRGGAAAVAVHPRGEQEIALAMRLLHEGEPLELGREHLDDTFLEHAAASKSRPYLERVLTGSTPE